MSNSAKAIGHRQASSGLMISDTELERALDFLRDSADDLGNARARLVSAGHMVKHVEAIEFKMADGSIEFRKASARTSERYMQATVEEAEAAGEFEKLKALREAAALKIQAWQSMSANARAML